MSTTHDLRTRLREADPVGTEPPLSPDEAARMRRAILAASAEPSVSHSRPRLTLALAAMLTIAATVGAISARRFAARLEPPAATPDATVAAARTQVQFSTPGGTRIIWTFDPEFSLKESMP